MPRLPYRDVCLSACSAVVLSYLFLSISGPSTQPRALADDRPAVKEQEAASRAAAKPTAPKLHAENIEPLPEQFLAFDVSRPFGNRRERFNAEQWAQFCRASLRTGRRMVVVQARGSSTSNPYADLLLKGARAEGLRTAAYVFVNFRHSAPSGEAQMKRAIEAVGAEAKHLDFMVVDVENGAAGDMTQAERVNCIGQAVEAATLAHLRPVIYAKNTGGRRGEWTDLTGNAKDFSYLPLWVPRYDLRADLEQDGYGGMGWASFGGWATRHGKQFADDKLTAAPLGLNADENIFTRDVVSGPSKPRPYGVTGLVKVVAGKPTRDKKTGEVVQPVKLVNRSKSTINGPLSLVLEKLTEHSPLVNGVGEEDETRDPYVKLSSTKLAPGASVRTELRFAATTSAPPSYAAEVRAGAGDL